jgi:hypothetical protein
MFFLKVFSCTCLLIITPVGWNWKFYKEFQKSKDDINLGYAFKRYLYDLYFLNVFFKRVLMYLFINYIGKDKIWQLKTLYSDYFFISKV